MVAGFRFAGFRKAADLVVGAVGIAGLTSLGSSLKNVAKGQQPTNG